MGINTAHLSYERSTTFAGVVRTPTVGRRQVFRITRPWRAQLRAFGKLFYLGAYETEEEAARAYDNAAFYLGVRHGYKYRRLNFPGDWDSDSYIPPTAETDKALWGCRMHKLARGHLPKEVSAEESLKKLVPIFLKFKAALEEAGFGESINVECSSRSA
jgi:hypothetical protein